MNGLLEKTIHEDGTHPFPGATIRKCHKQDGTDNRNAFPLISAGWKSKIKMPAGLVPLTALRENGPRPLYWLLVASGTPWLVSRFPRVLALYMSASTFPLVRMPVMLD